MVEASVPFLLTFRVSKWSVPLAGATFSGLWLCYENLLFEMRVSLPYTAFRVSSSWFRVLLTISRNEISSLCMNQGITRPPHLLPTLVSSNTTNGTSILQRELGSCACTKRASEDLWLRVRSPQVSLKRKSVRLLRQQRLVAHSGHAAQLVHVRARLDRMPLPTSPFPFLHSMENPRSKTMAELTWICVASRSKPRIRRGSTPPRCTTASDGTLAA